MNEIPDLNDSLSSVRRLFRWLFSRRILRRVLLGIAGVMTLVAILYTRVNVHGKAEWENCKRDMAVRGEVWDWAAFAPTPVPDDQNILNAPRMSEWFGDSRGLIEGPLAQPITNSFARRLFNTNSMAEIRTAPEATRYLAWSDSFQNDFTILGAALQRPYVRMVADYSQPFSITLPNVVTLNAVVKTLGQRAKCHLLLGQPEKAWPELVLVRDLRRLVEGQGKFITTEGDWIRRELGKHWLRIIAQGLEWHAWQEPQLIALQQQLKESDCIAGFIAALQCGRALAVSSLQAAPTDDGNFYKAMFMAGGDTFWTRLKKHPEFLLIRLGPRGMMYERARSFSEKTRSMIQALSPANGTIRPDAVRQAFAPWKKAQQGLPALLQAQTLIHQGQIACALERYYRAHGKYPEGLDALVPRFMEKLPHDIINGQPLNYRRTDDGNFLLYSVGWNETDEGGKDVFSPARPESVRDGDWVWMKASKVE